MVIGPLESILLGAGIFAFIALWANNWFRPTDQEVIDKVVDIQIKAFMAACEAARQP